MRLPKLARLQTIPFSLEIKLHATAAHIRSSSPREGGKIEKNQTKSNNKTNKCIHTGVSQPSLAEMSLFVLFNPLQIPLRDFSSRKENRRRRSPKKAGSQQIKGGQTISHCCADIDVGITRRGWVSLADVIPPPPRIMMTKMRLSSSSSSRQKDGLKRTNNGRVVT
jgi:hypothetical protein